MNPDSLEDTADYSPSEALVEMRAPSSGSASVHVDIAARTHRGWVRPENQDHYLVIQAGRFLRTMATSLPTGLVPDEYVDTLYGMAVADGMGGMAGGEVASRLALARLVELVIETPDWIVPRDEVDMQEMLRRARLRFRDVNATVAAEARRDPSLAGMGTTLTLAWSLGADLWVAHVGDSRAYLSRQGEFQALTRDHTLGRELAQEASSPAERAAAHRLRHVLTQFIGGPETRCVPEVQQFRLADGDRLLLCSDGLIDMVDDATIEAALQRDAAADAISQSLVDLALEGGGRDNVTVIVAQYQVACES